MTTCVCRQMFVSFEVHRIVIEQAQFWREHVDGCEDIEQHIFLNVCFLIIFGPRKAESSAWMRVMAMILLGQKLILI
jgi:hypothetical protein